MMQTSTTLLVVLLSLVVTASGEKAVFKARIRPIKGSGSNVDGRVTVETTGDGSTLIYVGSLFGVTPNLNTPDCQATNGCGAHIHDGFSCDNADTQGGHLFVSPIVDDPWVDKRWVSGNAGNARFADGIAIGTNDLQGKPFVGK